MPEQTSTAKGIPARPARAPALLLAVAGPAGSGKTTLCERMVREVQGLERVVTSTTRAPREGEVSGRDYHFFTNEEFDRLVAGGAFLEWARVHGADRRYGTLRRVIEDKLAADINLCLNIDVQGVSNLRRTAAADPLLSRRLVTVFLMPSGIDELRRRLHGRGKDSAAEIDRRMETALREMAEWVDYDFCILSGTPDQDFDALRGIFLAEKNRVGRLLA